MVVGDEQAVRRDERPRAAVVEAHGREPGVFEPGVGEVEVVFLFQALAWRIVEQPHAFVGVGGHGEKSQEQDGEIYAHRLRLEKQATGK